MTRTTSTTHRWTTTRARAPRPTTRSSAHGADEAASYRVMDPNVVSPAFQQLQQKRNYYQFPKTLDVDRYKDAAGKDQDTVIGLRELNLDGHPQAQLDQRPLHVHPRLRRDRRQGHHDGHEPEGLPGLHRVRSADHRPARHVRAADLLRREDRAVLHRRRAPEGARLRGGRREDHQLQGQQRGQSLQRLQPRRVRGVVQRAADPLLGGHRRRLADSLQPHAQGARRGGRPVADHRRRRLSGRGEPPHPVGRRRVHHHQRVPVRLAYDAR